MNDVFEDGPKLDRPVNLGLLLFAQAQALGVAATFDVEDSVVAPAMFVVADQPAARVGRKRGFSGAREPEEQRGVTLAPWLALQCIDRTPLFGIQ